MIDQFTQEGVMRINKNVHNKEGLIEIFIL